MSFAARLHPETFGLFRPPCRRISRLKVLACLLLAPALRAGTGIMDWGTGTDCFDSMTVSDLVFTNARGRFCSQDGTGINSISNDTIFSNDVRGLNVVHVEGRPFTALTIDIGEYSRTVNDGHVGFVGYKEDGSVVTVQAPLDGVADGPGGSPDFQTFVFPASFQNIVRLAVPAGFWSFDNFVFSTVISPSLPEILPPGPCYRSVRTILSKWLHEELFAVGPDYTLRSGFSAPDHTQFFLPGNALGLDGTYSPHYSRETSTLYFANASRTALSSHHNGVTTPVITTADTVETGWPMSGLDLPRWAGGPIVFLGYNTSGQDQFGIFIKGFGPTLALITPQTPLPGPSGTALSTPDAFPQDIAVHPIGFAFDTSLASEPSVRRLYASFFGMPPQHIVGKNDVLPAAGGSVTVTNLQGFAFNQNGDLEVDVTLNTGTARLYFNPAGLQSILATTLTVAPVNAGKMVSGSLTPATPTSPALLTTSTGELYRESSGRYFRVAGIGDEIGGETITSLELKAVPSLAPARAVVEVRYASNPNLAHILELELETPTAYPPRLGSPSIDPESGDWFIPLSHTTADKSYWLARSTDLQTWQRLWRIERISPLQQVFIPRAQTVAPSVFFRVEEE